MHPQILCTKFNLKQLTLTFTSVMQPFRDEDFHDSIYMGIYHVLFFINGTTVSWSWDVFALYEHYDALMPLFPGSAASPCNVLSKVNRSVTITNACPIYPGMWT